MEFNLHYQSLGLGAVMLFSNNDAGISNNRQGALHVSQIENKQNYQGLLGKKGSDVQKPSLSLAERLLRLSNKIKNKFKKGISEKKIPFRLNQNNQ